MAILNHHRSRSTRLLRTSTSSTGLTEDDDRDDARPHAKRRRATRAKFVNIAVHDSPSSQESASASSGRGRRGFFGKTVGNATRQALAVMNTNGFSASRLLARLPTRRGRSRGQPTPIKPLERQRSGASVNDADEEDLERWAGRKRKRGGEVVEPEPVTTLRDGKTRKVISTSQEHARRRRRSDDAMDVDVDEDEDEDEDDSVVVEDGEEEDGPNSGVIETDEFFISSAPSWRLHRLKREDLVRLYGTANGDTGRSRRSSYIQDDPVHHWTKSELVEALIATVSEQYSAVEADCL
ncbi:hypothetical protein CALVIDRAFT_62121 [Calocera viscosa TUFC12733]|uniref:Uncharacterized protein n=1 Tax=Calocera viscosa (strain TUFC12733) TaxID=1330018 RepID=A0A167NM36_CALVF|nr:hypothetical protein CALVIDRAFT_62121 [Calocera viscosa TUFC12733]